MTRTDFAFLMSPLPLAPLMLAVGACGGESGEGRKGDAPAGPLGFELAMAATADDAAAPLPAPASLVSLSPEELAQRIKAGDVRLIDVRTDEEVAEGAPSPAQNTSRSTGSIPPRSPRMTGARWCSTAAPAAARPSPPKSWPRRQARPRRTSRAASSPGRLRASRSPNADRALTLPC